MKASLYFLFLFPILCKAQEACVVVKAPYEMEQFDKIDEAYQQAIIDFIPFQKNGYKVTFYLGEISYAFIDCRSDWFRYINGQWENIYTLDNHGFTCSPTIFIDDGLPHIFGGYGIWRGQSLNMKLTPYGEWSIISSPTIPDFYNPSAGFNYGDSAVVLIGGFYVNTAKGVREVTSDCYIVSNSGYWTSTNCIIDSSSFHVDPGYTQLSDNDYRVGVFTGDIGYQFLVQDKQTSEIKASAQQVTTEGEGTFLLQNDSLYIIDNNKRVVSFAIVGLFNNGKSMKFIPHDQTKDWGLSWYLIFLMPALLGLPFIIRSFSENNIKPELYSMIMNKTGSSFSTNELNQLLQIDHLSYDRIRKRRSDIIQELNEYHKKTKGKDLVIRKRDPDDQRHFIFVIEK